jgi:hypothetical protein
LCHYAEHHHAVIILKAIQLSVIMLNVIILSVVMLNVIILGCFEIWRQVEKPDDLIPNGEIPNEKILSTESLIQINH